MKKNAGQIAGGRDVARNVSHAHVVTNLMTLNRCRIHVLSNVISLLMCVGFEKLQWLQEPLTFKIAHVIYFVKDKENSRQFFLSFHM